jgi:hypothetical protein
VVTGAPGDGHGVADGGEPHRPAGGRGGPGQDLLEICARAWR